MTGTGTSTPQAPWQWLLELLADAALVFDGDGRVRWLNAAAARRCSDGATADSAVDALLSRGWGATVAQAWRAARARQRSDAPAAHEALQAWVPQGPHGRPSRIHLQLGSVHEGLWAVVLRESAVGAVPPSRSPAGCTPDGVLGLAAVDDGRDLIDSRAVLLAAIQHNPDALWVANANGELVAFNAGYLRFHRLPEGSTGWRRLDELSQEIDLFLPDGRAIAHEDWPTRRALRGETTEAAEIWLRRRDSGESWLGLASVTPVLGSDGRVIGATGHAREISHVQRGQMELELQSGKDTATAIVHELNQPLTAVANYNDAAVRLLDRATTQPERLKQALLGSIAQAERASQVMRQLIGYLQGQAEGPARCELMASIAQICQRYRDCFGEQLCIAATQGMPDTWAQIHRLPFEKVLCNLIDNAIDAMRTMPGPREGPMRVTLRLTAPQATPLLELAVQDNGPGIDAALMPRLFEPFFTTKARGVGVGLAVSRSIIEAHGGRLWAESDGIAGHGATFRFTLPRATSDA